MSVAAELVPDHVRRNWLGQVVRYSLAVARWRRKLFSYHRDPARYVEEKLPVAIRELLRVAQIDTAFYPDRFHQAGVQWSDLRTAEDLRHFPALSRRDVQERYRDIAAFSLDQAARDEGIFWQTSGSTGQPVRFFVNGESNKWPLAFYRFLMGRGPGRPFSHGVVLLCALPRSAIVRTWLPLFGGTYFRKLHWAEPESAATLARLNPRVITGDPDSLGVLEKALASEEIRIKPRLILSSAFELPEERSRTLGARTGARVVDCYSIAETGPLAWRCGAGRPFHLLGSAAHVETDSAGEILVTNLRNPLFPLVRYRTGDLGEIVWRDCECGYRGPSLVRLLGRRASRFVSASGDLVDPSRVEPLLAKLPVFQYQLVQKADRVLLRYHGREELRDLSDLQRALDRLLGRASTLDTVRSADPLWRPGEKPLPYARIKN